MKTGIEGRTGSGKLTPYRPSFELAVRSNLDPFEEYSDLDFGRLRTSASFGIKSGRNEESQILHLLRMERIGAWVRGS
ncbi:hypothetical protein AAG906_021049 [Vitis piasezkii]